MFPEGSHYCGYLFNNNFLCVSDTENKYIRIWDLVNRSIYKQIKIDGYQGLEIIPWNPIYTIVACNDCFVIINIEEGKMVKKVIFEDNTSQLNGIKKIKLNDLGECLIGSKGHKIILFN